MPVRFSSPELQPTYEALINGSSDYDWIVFHHAVKDMELKVQCTGTGLEDLEDEFIDGRWVRVV
jgi:hypothetical protein